MRTLERTVLGFALLFPCLGGLPGESAAAPIDNPGPNCDFHFYVNGSLPFFDFSSGEFISSIPSPNYFTADTDSAGNMTFVGSSMQLLETSAGFLGVPISMRLQFTDVVGTTDLSGVDPQVDWTMTAVARFNHGLLGVSESNCQSAPFDIEISGSWHDVESTSFVIPAFASTDCNGYGTLMNIVYGLGSNGATLTLYKFEGYNGVNLLSGS